MRKASEPLPNILNTIEEGISKLSICIDDIDIIFTHSLYGDEHSNPHHSQVFEEVSKWTFKNSLNLSTFGVVPYPFYLYESIMLETEMNEKVIVLNKWKILNSPKMILKYPIQFIKSLFSLRPKYRIQIELLEDIKKDLWHKYSSINPEESYQQYTYLNSRTESFDFYNKKSFQIFIKSLGKLETCSYKDIFRLKISLKDRFLNKISP